MHKTTYRTPIAILFAIVLIYGFVALIVKSGFFDSATAEETPLLRQGMALHAALWNYEEKHGKLPATLTDLVPDYLNEADLDAPPPHSGGPMFQLVAPNQPRANRRTNGDLIVSSPIKSANREDKRIVYVRENGDVGVRAIE